MIARVWEQIEKLLLSRIDAMVRLPTGHCGVGKEAYSSTTTLARREGLLAAHPISNALRVGWVIAFGVGIRHGFRLRRLR